MRIKGRKALKTLSTKHLIIGCLFIYLFKVFKISALKKINTSNFKNYPQD